MKSWKAPLCVLLAVLALTLWNSRCLTRRCGVWIGLLGRMEEAVQQEDWPAAADTMDALYADWQARQTWLRTVIRHDEIDETEALLQRCFALCDARQGPELLTELYDLRAQFVLMDETERLSIQNIF